MKTLFLLVAGHALGDFGLQSDWMAKSKMPGAFSFWPHVLMAHSLIQGLTVYLATGSTGLGIAETAAHFLVDYGKGHGWYGFQGDQFIHLGFRLLWWGISAHGGLP